jgi:hypothetical protein
MKKLTKIVASATVLAVFGAFAAGAAQAEDRSKANASCRKEIKRVAVWPEGPKGPKAQRIARFEDREITICDGKVVSSRKLDSSLKADESSE